MIYCLNIFGKSSILPSLSISSPFLYHFFPLSPLKISYYDNPRRACVYSRDRLRRTGLHYASLFGEPANWVHVSSSLRAFAVVNNVTSEAVINFGMLVCRDYPESLI